MTTRSVGKSFVVGVGFAGLAMSSCASCDHSNGNKELRPNAVVVPAVPSSPGPAPSGAVDTPLKVDNWNGFHVGKRVRAIGHGGTVAMLTGGRTEQMFGPAIIGRPTTVELRPGQEGTVKGFISRRHLASNTEFNLVVVTWDAHVWQKPVDAKFLTAISEHAQASKLPNSASNTVSLPAFDAPTRPTVLLELP